MSITTDHATAAVDWFPRVAAELELLDGGAATWRQPAAERLRAVAAGGADVTPDVADLLALVAAELLGEEDEGALDRGLVTWRTLAADEIARLASALRAKI